MASSTSAPASYVAARSEAKTILGSISYFFIRRRIFLSAVLFAILVTVDVVTGVRPHDLTNLADPVTVIGTLLVVIGLATRSWAAGILRKDEEVTTCGPYRLVRNPLYLGSFLMMFGFCALIGDVATWFLLVLPMIALYLVKVRNEERWLGKLYPGQWAAYSAKTPRFLPRIAHTDIATSWYSSQWLRAREYQAILASVVALAAIKIWQSIG